MLLTLRGGETIPVFAVLLQLQSSGNPSNKVQNLVLRLFSGFFVQSQSGAAEEETVKDSGGLLE
jgi:hypothetical protein